MFPAQFKKILGLIKKTGDRVIIFNPEAPEDAYVIMDLDKYAALVDKEDLLKKHPATQNPAPPANLTEEDLTDKINREILMWKNRESAAYPEEDDEARKAWQISPQVKAKAQEIE